MSISLNGYGENAVTLKITEDVTLHQPVTISENFTVRPCKNGENFIGTIINKKGNYAAVKLSGYTELGYSGEKPQFGVCKLACDGNGKVTVSENGRYFIVTNVDTDTSTVGIIL